MRILAVSGSLRASSSNTALLQAAVALAPRGIDLSFYAGLGDIPHFNPDLDDERVSRAVTDWRAQLQSSDGVVFSTPEYAHDWVVGSGELAEKPVTLFNASPRGTYAQDALTETLTVMSAKVVLASALTLQLLGRSLSASQVAADPAMSAALRAGIDSFALAISHHIMGNPARNVGVS